jgi:hypothetical protein
LLAHLAWACHGIITTIGDPHHEESTILCFGKINSMEAVEFGMDSIPDSLASGMRFLEPVATRGHNLICLQ